jgi:hypothetical protein
MSNAWKVTDHEPTDTQSLEDLRRGIHEGPDRSVTERLRDARLDGWVP